MSNLITNNSNADTITGISEETYKSLLNQNDSLNAELQQLTDSTAFLNDSIAFSKPEDINYISVLQNTGKDFLTLLEQYENSLPVNIRSNQNGDWLTIILLFAFVLLVSVRAGFQKYISSLFQSVVNYSTSFRLFREKNFSFLHVAFRLEVLFYLVFSVFIFQILMIQSSADVNSGLLLFGKTTALIVFYFLAKKFVYWLLGVIFKSSSETSEFLFNLDNNNRATSIILLPVVAVIAYFPFGNPGIIIILGAIAVGFMYLMSLWRGTIILLKKQFSIFYLFLYLCTLEFLPLLLIYKMVAE